MASAIAKIRSVALAGLLHDIGKFYERTDTGESKIKGVSEAYKYSHAKYTSQALEDYGSIIPFDLSTSLSDDNLDNVKGIASYHHNPGTALQTIVAVADWCSSGMDREEAERAYSEGGKKFARLIPVFESVDLGGNPDPAGKYRYQLSPLNPGNETIFPVKDPEAIDLTGGYKALWDSFIAELRAIPRTNEERQFNDLVSVLQKYTWCIPSTAQVQMLPDISLFDHLKTTAAIASTLYSYHMDGDALDRSTIENYEEQKFLIISGDLSGIQSYLFDLSKTNPRGATRILRGRSYYIGLVTQAASQFILRKLGCPITNCIMDAGGRFTLLLPNTEKTKAQLGDLESTITEWCYKNFLGRLVILLDYSVTMSPNDFMDKRFADKLDETSDALSKKKQHKFYEILQQNGKWQLDKFVLVNYEQFKDYGACYFDDRSPAELKRKYYEEDEEKKVNKINHFQYLLGDWLTDMKRIAWNDTDVSDKQISFFDGRVFANFFKSNSVIPDSCYQLNTIKEYFPEHSPGKLMTFEDLSKAGIEDVKGVKLGKEFLGILKADVDSMGLMFSVGFLKVKGESTRNYLSISRYTSLSRMLNLFFSDYLTHLREKEFRNIYNVYAGGDDLFMLGPWEQTINFAVRLRKDFARYCCHNPDIHLSAGISLIKSRYPLRRAADMAEELLEEAKKAGKNRLNLFNTVVEWENLSKLTDFKDFLNQSVRDGASEISSSFLNRLLKYHNMFRQAYVGDAGGKLDLAGLRFHALMAYDIRRNIARYKDNKLVNEEEIGELYRLYDLKRIDSSLMQNLKIPLFWAMYKNRK